VNDLHCFLLREGGRFIGADKGQLTRLAGGQGDDLAGGWYSRPCPERLACSPREPLGKADTNHQDGEHTEQDRLNERLMG
jgi:hypothetical protein